ncbi:MAG: hypothetical protein WCX73_03180 [Candidatus Pacearchaeota archaeon]|jgi:hypothetical protein
MKIEVKGSYNVGFKDLKFLVDGFEDYFWSRQEGVNWCKENKTIITPEFMKNIYGAPDEFFYRITHDEDDITNLIPVETSSGSNFSEGIDPFLLDVLDKHSNDSDLGIYF